MKIHARKLVAQFSANSNRWHVDLEEFNFWIQVLAIKRILNVKLKYQLVKAEDVDLELIDNWLILHSWGKIKKKKLYMAYDPDKPRNLAKTVTVK